MLQWNDLPCTVKDRVVTIYEMNGLAAALEAVELLSVEITGKNLQRRIQEHRKMMRNVFQEEGQARTILNALKPSYSIPVPSVNTKQTPAPLTDIYLIDMDTDQGHWLEWLHDAAGGRRFVTVMHLCDIHFPFEHAPALEVVYQLVQHIQPDLIVVGSDAADFALISTFDKDADLDEATDDVLDEFERHWNPFIHRLKEAAPHSVLAYIWGNHERRIHAFLNREAPKFRKRILRDFVDLIRCGDSVFYVGYTDYLRVGPLVVHHGTRTGLYAAKNALYDAGGQISLMGGHTHQPSEFEIRGEDHTVKSIISGCLCAYPHYMAGERMTKPWALGTAIADVDLRSRDVQFNNLIFGLALERVWARYERSVFEAPVPMPEGAVTFEDYLVQHLG